MISTLLLLITITAAQVAPTARNAPTPVTQLEYTSISDRTLFVRGGVAGLQPVVQFFSLDLRPLVSGTGKPTWTSLNTTHSNNTDYTSQFAMSVTFDNTTLLYFRNDTLITMYDIGANTWSPSRGMKNPYPEDPLPLMRSRLQAVTDPNTGLVYVPGAGRSEGTMSFNPATSESSRLPRYADDSTLEYNFAWNRLRGSMLLFGRLNSSIPVLWQMTTGGNWTELGTKGSWPAANGESCMVTAQGGRKMVVFGGRMGTQDPVGDLYFLNLTTTPYTWTNDVSATRGRAGMACASAGNYFVAWGGTNGTDLPSEILYYNLATNQWVSEDSINDPSFTGTGAPRPTDTNIGSSNSGLPKSTMAGLGGGIAAVVVIGSIAIFVVLRRRRRRNDKLVTAGSGNAHEGQKYELTTDGKDYSGPHAVITSRRAPQWIETDDQITFSHLRNKDPQDGSHMPMNVYERLGAPHKYLPNQHNNPQQIPLFTNTSNNILFDSHQQQQQQQQQQQDDVIGPRSPKGSSVSATSPDENSAPDPLSLLALIEARHQQKLERLRREQEADLLLLQQQWEQMNIENKSP